MVNLGPQRENVNNTIDLVNSSFKVSRVEDPPVFKKLERGDTIEQELKETKKLQEKSRKYRKNKTYETGKAPLKTGPIRILRFQLYTLEEELAEHQLRLREQKQVQK